MNQTTTTDRNAAPPRRRRRLRLLGAALLVIALAAGGLWFARDLPRRWVEGRLSATLDADVRLGRFEIQDLSHFVLHRIDVQKVNWESRVERIAIDRLEVAATIREALDGHYPRLTIDGVEVRLVPPTEAASPLPGAATRIDSIELRGGRLFLADPDEASAIEFTASLNDWGGAPSGRFSLAAASFDPASLLALSPAANTTPGDGADATYTIDIVGLRVNGDLSEGGDPVELEAEAEHVRGSYRDHRFAWRGLRVAATIVPSEEDRELHVNLRPELTGIDRAVVEAILDDESYGLRSGQVNLEGVAIAALLEAGLPLPAGWTVEGAADLDLRTADGTHFAYELATRLTRVELPLPRGATFSSEGLEATASGAWDRTAGVPAPFTYLVEAALAETHLAASEGTFVAKATGLTANGTLDAQRNAAIDLHVTVPAGSGRFGDRELPDESFPIEVRVEGSLSAAATEFDGTTQVLSPALGHWQIQGLSRFSGSLLAEWQWVWSDSPTLSALQLTAERSGLGSGPAGLRVEGRPTARGSLRGALTDPALRGELRIDDLEASPRTDASGGAGEAEASWSVGPTAATIRFSRETGDGGLLDVQLPELHGPVEVPTPGASWRPVVGLSAEGRADLRMGELQLIRSLVEVPELGSLQAEGQIAASGDVTLDARVGPVELAAVRALSASWFDDPAPDYSLQGALTSRLAVQATSTTGWSARGDFDLVDVGTSSADGARVFQGAEIHGTLQASNPPGGSPIAEATAAVTGPVLLWGTLFADYSGNLSELRLAANHSGDRWDASAEWRLPESVSVRGSLAGAPASRVEYTTELGIPDLSAFLDRYIREPFEGSVATLDTLGAAGSLQLELHGGLTDEGHSLEGRLQTTDAAFSGSGGANAIEGMSLDLPVSLRWDRDGDGVPRLAPGPDVIGSVTHDGVRLGGLEFPPLDTPLTVSSDTVRLDRPLDFALLDGRVALQQLALTRWSRESRDLTFGLQLHDLSLDALTRNLGTYPMDGTMSGSFPAVHLTPELLQIDGGGTVDVFGGTVEIYDISGQGILSRFPRFRFSANLDAIHLFELTRTFDFGAVYGVVSGEIRDCELFGGAPVRCEASLATVKTEGVPRKISVKAIRNISILGAGPKVGILDRGLQKFLDTYTYSRLGFTMQLAQDRFLLRGTERRGSRELFVKGRLPFRIDIVNAAPGQTVSFQSMMNRLQNLQIAPPAAKERKSPPVERR